MFHDLLGGWWVGWRRRKNSELQIHA